MKVVFALPIALSLTACTSFERWSDYESLSPESTTQDGIIYYLKIDSKRRDFDVDPLLLTGSSGPP